MEVVDEAPHNALYERPAMRHLIGDPSGLDVLDVGCGSGYFLEYVLNAGAACVAGVDGTGTMIEAARSRTRGRAAIHVADLREPLSFLDNASFDLVIASLVLHYLDDWAPLLLELHRVLRPSGAVVLSTGHPFSDFMQSPSGNYFETELIREDWSSFGVTMPSYRRPLTAVISSFQDAGFSLSNVTEPYPRPEMEKIKPKSYMKLTKQPGFICFRFRRD